MEDARRELATKDARTNCVNERRRMLMWIGFGTVAVPLLGLTGCGDDEEPMRGNTMDLTTDTTVDPAGAGASDRSSGDSRARYGDQASSDINESVASSSSTARMDESGAPGDQSMRSARSDAGEGESSRMSQQDSSAGRADAQVFASDRGGSGGGMDKVDVSSSQAQSLSYVHEASRVDASAQPRYEEGQQCSNCSLYQGGDQPWGGCPLFAGKRVKATGWCNAYIAAS